MAHGLDDQPHVEPAKRAHVEGGVELCALQAALERQQVVKGEPVRQQRHAGAAKPGEEAAVGGVELGSRLRVLVRNLLVGGGASVVLLYPEFVLRTAPYVAGKVSAKLPSREALIPKIKPPPRDGA